MIRRTIIRIFITIILPFMLLWTVLYRIWKEIKSIPLFLKCDISEEWNMYLILMKNASILTSENEL